MRIAGAALCALAIAAGAPAVDAGIINTFDLITTGNFSSTSDVEGKAFIGGDLVGNGSTFAMSLSSTTSPTLIVAGNFNVNNQINLNNGSLELAGTASKVHGGINFNDSNSAAHVITYDSTLPTTAGTYAAALTSYSKAYTNLLTNSTVDAVPSQPGPVTLHANPVNGVAVFSIDASLLNNQNVQKLVLDNSKGATSIVINVTGSTSVTLSSAVNIDSSFNAYTAKTLWNFQTAKSIDLEGHFDGAILAPMADLHNATAIDGAVFVKSMINSNNGEIHLPYYAGFTPDIDTSAAVTTPEPTAFALAGTGALTGLALLRKRKAAK